MKMQSDNKLKSVGVVYLIYIPYGTSLFENFLQSYLTFPAGAEHELLLIFKGSITEAEKDVYLKEIEKYNIKTANLHYYGKGFDIDTYFWAAKQLNFDYLFFFNSSSQILHDNWLQSYINHLGEKAGLITASASWQSYYSSVFIKNSWKWERTKTFSHNFRKYKLFLKALFYWRLLFKPFPNPHARTNAFIVQREVFLSMNSPLLRTKFQAYFFESGRKSLTNQYLKKGYKVLVVDKTGKAYDPVEWPRSKTFWINKQENLLISDNQTRLYEQADEKRRKELTFLAWGN